MKIKGFDKDLKCRGMQFEIGEIYDTGAKDDEIHLCSNTVFHYCDSISKVHNQYRCDRENRFCEIEVLGAEVTDGGQCGSNRIKVIREIVGDELDVLLGKINGNTGLFNTGNCNTGDWNTCSGSNGVFCTEEDRNIRIFNVPSGMSLSEFRNSEYYDALMSSPFLLTEWVEYTQAEMDTEEKKSCR